MTKHLPKILHQSITTKSRYFSIETLHLEFSNGEQRIYERLSGGGLGAVMIVPVTAEGELILVREYAAGTESYELGFPKGMVDVGESAEQAANRELREEVGVAAKHIEFLKCLIQSPSYLTSEMSIFVAHDLFDSPLTGDEPETLEMVKVPVAEAMRLVDENMVREAQSVAAVYLFHQWWNAKKSIGE